MCEQSEQKNTIMHHCRGVWYGNQKMMRGPFGIFSYRNRFLLTCFNQVGQTVSKKGPFLANRMNSFHNLQNMFTFYKEVFSVCNTSSNRIEAVDDIIAASSRSFCVTLGCSRRLNRQPKIFHLKRKYRTRSYKICFSAVSTVRTQSCQ